MGGLPLSGEVSQSAQWAVRWILLSYQYRFHNDGSSSHSTAHGCGIIALPTWLSKTPQYPDWIVSWAVQFSKLLPLWQRQINYAMNLKPHVTRLMGSRYESTPLLQRRHLADTLDSSINQVYTFLSHASISDVELLVCLKDMIALWVRFRWQTQSSYSQVLKYISWVSNGQPAWTLKASGVGPDNEVQISARPVPQEPMVCSLSLRTSTSYECSSVYHH